jgi:hypothetical protein
VQTDAGPTARSSMRRRLSRPVGRDQVGATRFRMITAVASAAKTRICPEDVGHGEAVGVVDPRPGARGEQVAERGPGPDAEAEQVDRCGQLDGNSGASCLTRGASRPSSQAFARFNRLEPGASVVVTGGRGFSGCGPRGAPSTAAARPLRDRSGPIGGCRRRFRRRTGCEAGGHQLRAQSTRSSGCRTLARSPRCCPAPSRPSWGVRAVSTRVNKVGSDGPDHIAPLSGSAAESEWQLRLGA